MTNATEEEALTLLKEVGVNYRLVRHPALHHLGDPNAPKGIPQMKSLLLKTKRDQQYYLYLTKKARINFGQVAQAINSSKSQLNFASDDDLMRLLTVHSGTVTPLALTHDHHNEVILLVDHEIKADDQVAVHPNQNQATVIMNWLDFTQVMQAINHPITVIEG